MREIIKTNYDSCEGCNRCVRECPTEMANVAYQDENGDNKVRVDNSKCIVCGRCVSACKHDARQYEDDTSRFFDDLVNGAPISLMAAPAVKTNLPEYKRLFTYLKKLGVVKIYDVSLGADICIWAHIRYFEQNGATPLIASPCPAIVSYCEMYRHDLLPKLFPIQGPMATTAIYMREYDGVEGRLAALSPCIAKISEFEDTGLVQYNVTFTGLLRHLNQNNVELPVEETGFDHDESGLGALFPMPGGFKENFDCVTGGAYHVSQAEGDGIFSKLATYASTSEEFLPDVFDVLNCSEGCNEGPGCAHEKSVFEIGHGMKRIRKSVTESRTRKDYGDLYKEYDRRFELKSFIRGYKEKRISCPDISKNDIDEAYKKLGKNSLAEKHVDCGACGSETCLDMARKIALKANIPENCIVKSRNDAREEHKMNLVTLEDNVKKTEIIMDMLERFETIWNNVESGIAIIDAETRKTIDVNPVAVRMYGSEKEKIVGCKCNRTFCADEACPITDNSIVMDHSERQFVNAAGETIPVVKSVSTINYDGKPALLESFTDISSLKEVEEKLRLMEVADQANHAKSNFLANMSHEMRTPMNAIIGMTQIAAKSGDIEKLRYCLSMIENSSSHLLGLINDILDMSKIEAGKFNLEHVSINIEKMLIKVCNLIIDKIESKSIHFNIILSQEMRMNYVGDELRLSQVVTNLMSNAVKFTPECGEIELTAHEVDRGDDFGVLRFTIKDTGVGMSAEQLGRLFNVFEQADSSTSRKFGGTGLGLAISKSIVEKMDGRIWVESEEGKGSTFIFEVKLERPKHQERAVIFGNIHPKDVNLLVVCGDVETRRYFKSITDSFGIDADVADSIDRALSLTKLAKAAQKPYDIIFVDHGLGGMDSIEVIRGIKCEIDKNTTVVVMATFLKWNKIEKKAKKQGVSRFISKPLFPSSILNEINEAIGCAAQNLDLTLENTDDMPDFSDIKLLFAEDVEINREIFITLLEDTNAGIDVAENGSVAVEKFKANPDRYDMIIMDVQMPVMDGLAATRAIRNLDVAGAKEIPIVAMTANVFREDVEKCIGSGMNDHLAKPIDIGAVLEKIKLYCK